MPAPAQPKLEPGRVYRTRDLARWAKNAPRLARRLEREGKLIRLSHGLLASPRPSRWGPVPPTDEAVLTAFLDGSPFVFTGSDYWNPLGLGATAVHAITMAYNTKRSGLFSLGGQRYQLKRARFPEQPSAEWYVVDLLEHTDEAGISASDVVERLPLRLAAGAFNADRLHAMAVEYGSRATQALVTEALHAAGRS